MLVKEILIPYEYDLCSLKHFIQAALKTLQQ